MKIKLLVPILALFLKAAYGQDSPFSRITSFNTGTSFTCIAVDSGHNIWGGTNKKGLFRLEKDGTVFQPVPSASPYDISTFIIQTLAADKENLWVGHAGVAGITATFGGMDVFSTTTLERTRHLDPDFNRDCDTYRKKNGIGTRNTHSIAIDRNNTVWSAHDYDHTDATVSGSEIVTPGTFSTKPANQTDFTSKSTWKDVLEGKEAPEFPHPAYTCNIPTDQMGGIAGYRTCRSISCGKSEVWVNVWPYKYATARNANFKHNVISSANMPAQILRYSLDGTYKGVVRFETIGIPAGGVFNGIYLAPNEDAWVTTLAKGFAVQRSGNWTYMSIAALPCLLPAGTTINPNAIWGNSFGNVFIGTSNGLLVYNGRGPVNVSSSYSFTSSATNSDMVSNNIKAGRSENDSIQWMATDKGIMKAIIGRFSTLDPEKTDYTSCKNAEINTIEELMKQPGIKNDKSYHIYKVETKICSLDESKFCTAENIYKMIKDDVTLAAITPYDFPMDDLTLPFLKAVTPADLAQIQDKVNNWKMSSDRNPNQTYGEIQSIRGVVESPLLKEALKNQGVEFLAGQAFSLAYFSSAVPREIIMRKQLTVNPVKLESCNTRYHLFNSPNYIQSREVFIFGNTMHIGRLLMGCDVDGGVNPEYDPIYSYANDKEYTATNYTAKGHMLYPGKITRQVVEECGTVKIVTIGEGVQFCGDNSAGRANANGNSIVGCILFKNIDFRFVKKFETLK